MTLWLSACDEIWASLEQCACMPLRTRIPRNRALAHCLRPVLLFLALAWLVTCYHCGGVQNRIAQGVLSQRSPHQLRRPQMEPLSGNVFGILQKGGYQPGLNTQRNAAHIVVYHRYRQVLEEEIISPVVVLAMRNMYQSTFGSVVKSTGMYRYLQVRTWTLCAHNTTASYAHRIHV